MSNFKWIPLAGLNLSPANLAAAEKLRKFGFVINCGEFGSEKYIKSALCVYDVLAEKKDPNILIITRGSEMYSWYRVLITTIGADFKMVSGAENSLLYFYEKSSSLYIIPSETLFSANVLKRKAGSGFKWDLIIIDEELCKTVPDYAEYEKNIVWKTEKLLINVPFPAKKDEQKAALVSLIKNVLADGDKAAAANSLEFDASASGLSDNTPVMRYFNAPVYGDDFGREVTFVDYAYEETVLTYFRRRVDLKTGLPAYSAGGNVFEQYDCDKNEAEKKIYLKPFYSRSDVEDLRAFDKKLDALINVIDGALGDEEARVMIYCCNKNTVEYLRKALTCLYGKNVCVLRDELVSFSDIESKFKKTPDTRPQIAIGTDALGTSVEAPDIINCVVNFELPDSPAVLERRMTRHGFEHEAHRKFILFRDKNGVFDTPLLEKTLYLNLSAGFCGALASRNILLDIKEKGDILNSLIKDLKYLRDYSKQVDNCADLIKRVKCEYIVPGTEQITNAKQLKDFAESKINKLYKLLGVDDNSSAADVAAAAAVLSGLCAVNAQGKLEKVSNRAELAASFENDSFSNLPFASEAVTGLKDAKADVDELHKGDDFHLRIKQEIAEMNDSIQYSVLYGIWKYRAMEQDSPHSFKDYIKIYNDGILN